MGHITQFGIKNFKCFQDTTIPMAPLTVLAGGNSVGKSSTIQAMLLAKIVIDKASNNGQNARWLIDQKIPINGPYLLSLGNSTAALSKFADSNKISFNFYTNKGNLTIKLSGDDEKPQPDLLFEEYSYTNEYSSLLNTSILKSFHYLHAERVGPRVSYDIVSQSYPNCGPQGEYTAQILHNGRELEVNEKKSCFVVEGLEKKHDKNLKLRHQANRWMDFVIPGIEIDSIVYNDINKGRNLFSGFSPYNVGFGISFVLPVIVSGLIADPGALLIVENPEAHLHPFGQSRIGRFLATIAASGIQVIVETHSEHVINGIRIATLDGTISHQEVLVNFFSKNIDKAINIKEIIINEFGDLNAYPKGFFDQEQRDMAEIIRHKKKQ